MQDARSTCSLTENTLHLRRLPVHFGLAGTALHCPCRQSEAQRRCLKQQSVRRCRSQGSLCRAQILQHHGEAILAEDERIGVLRRVNGVALCAVVEHEQVARYDCLRVPKGGIGASQCTIGPLARL